MTTVEQLVKRVDYPLSLHDMKLWDLDSETITRAHLQGFYYRASVRTSKDEAREIVLRIADAITQASNAGAIHNTQLSNFSVSQPPMLSGELRIALELLTVPTRRCAFLALLMQWPIERAIDLKWADINYLRQFDGFNDLAIDTVQSMPRHISFPYVFWELDGDTPVKVNNARADVEIAFGFEFEVLLKRFSTMVISDPTLHAAELESYFAGKKDVI